MENTDILIIGGTSGMVAAITGRANYPDKNFLLIRKEQQMVVPCGIPYIFGSMESSEKDIMGDAGLNNAGVAIKIDEVVAIDQDNKTCKTNDGTEIHFATAIGNTAFGTAGLTESAARKEGFDVVTGTFEGTDKHPGTLPGTHKQLVKLIAARDCGVILGGGVVGGTSVGELTNIIGFIIENRMTVNAILTAQVGTHPLLTAPPTAYPLIKAAEVVVRNIRQAGMR